MSNTKTRMIEAAFNLILDKGIEATTVDDILQASNTGKSQFYHYFTSKSGMVTQVFERVHADLSAGRWGAHLLPVIESWDMVEGWLAAIGNAGRQDHPLLLLALSLRQEERAVQPLLMDLYQKLRDPLLSFLQAQQVAGFYLASANCEDLADMALTSMAGITIKGSINGVNDTQLVERVARHMSLYLKAYARA